MAIQYEKFLQWAESRFGGDVVLKGDEIMVNSIFVEDYKHHLSCNVTGGKLNLPNGVFHCWKSDKGGSLITLVMLVDKCSYEEALDTMDAVDTSLLELEKKLEDFFSNKKKTTKSIPTGLALPEKTFWIRELDESNVWRIEAENYLLNRKLPPEDYMICTEGVCKNRIIIPYFDPSGNLIYWNGRFLTDSDKIAKYRGPHKDCGIGKADVIYMAGGWPRAKTKLYLTEGEFDAKSLYLSGFEAGAIGGKSVEEKQIEMLRPYIPVLCFDTDDKKKDAGWDALLKISGQLKSKGLDEFYYVRPPKEFKDWNKMFTTVGPKLVKAYINQHERRYGGSTNLELRLKKI